MPWLIAVMGPTASGKSEVAEALAAELDARLIGADAFHVYRGLTIGTNKPTDPSQYELVDIKDPEEDFGVGEWVVLAQTVLRRLFASGTNAIVVGGTGLYIRALFEQWQDLGHAPDPELRAMLLRREIEEGTEVLASELVRKAPELAQRIDLRNPVRVRRALERLEAASPLIPVSLPPFRVAKFGIEIPSADLHATIDARARSLMDRGWPEEVAALTERGITLQHPSMRAIGYAQVVALNEGLVTRDAAIGEIQVMTRQYAKRQRTWLRSEPRLHLLKLESREEIALKCVSQVLQHLSER